MAGGRTRVGGRVLTLAALACAPPVVVLIAALGARTGAWDARFAHDMIAWTLGPVLAAASILAGAAAVVVALRGKTGKVAAFVALTVSLVTTGAYVWRFTSLQAGPDSVTTDAAAPPGWGPLSARRGQGGLAGFADCPTLRPVPTQAVPEVVVYVLQREGVEVVRAGVTGVYGIKRGFWFGFDQDVAVRIRPGRTDIRVAAHEPLRHDGGACDLAARISDGLTPD